MVSPSFVILFTLIWSEIYTYSVDIREVHYDHETFLGEEEAKKYLKYTPKDSQKHLSELITTKIDTNKDDKISQEELRTWLQKVAVEGIQQSSNSILANYKAMNGDMEGASPLTWNEFSYAQQLTHYPGIDKLLPEDESKLNETLERERIRWKNADRNGDDLLSQEEFFHFRHPEVASHMHPLLIEETIERFDKDKDGLISLSEYMEDFLPNYEELKSKSTKLEQIPAAEENFFLSNLDKNKDGKLDKEEVAAWIVPDDWDRSESQTKHFFLQADSNKDGVISKDEMLKNHKLFVGDKEESHHEVMKKHDEL